MENLSNSPETNARKNGIRQTLSQIAETASWLFHGMPEPGRQQPQAGRGWHFPDSQIPTPYDDPILRDLMKESPDGIVDIERIFTGESTD